MNTNTNSPHHDMWKKAMTAFFQNNSTDHSRLAQITATMSMTGFSEADLLCMAINQDNNIDLQVISNTCSLPVIPSE